MHTRTYEQAARTEWQLARMERMMTSIGYGGDRHTLEKLTVRELCDLMVENGVHLAVVEGQPPVTVCCD